MPSVDEFATWDLSFKKDLKLQIITVNSRFKKDLKLQIHLQKAFFGTTGF